MKAQDTGIREMVKKLFAESQAHMDFDSAMKGFTPELAARRVSGLPHTAWQLVWHIWRSQKDILDYHENTEYAEMPWPEGYWPKEDGPANAAQWRAAVQGFRDDAAHIARMLDDPAEDLLAPKAAKRTNLLRVALLSMDHNAYHIGQLVDVKRLLGMKV